MSTIQPQHKIVVISGANRGLGYEFVRQLLLTPQPPLHSLTSAQHCSEYTIIALTRTINLDHWQSLQTELEQLNQQQPTTTQIDSPAQTNIQQQYIPRHLIIQQCDVTKQEDTNNLVSFITKEYNRVDIFISNAGIIEPNPQTSVSDLTTFDPLTMNIFQTNAIAPVTLTNNLIPFLMNANQLLTPTTNNQKTTIEFDSTINAGVQLTTNEQPNQLQHVQCNYISSDMGSLSHTNMPLCPTYRSSKAALNMYVKTLSIQYPTINFLPLSPGWVKTDMGSRGNRSPPLQPSESISGMLNQMNTHMYSKDSGQGIYSYDDSIIPW